MFTGIIEETGQVKRTSTGSAWGQIVIAASTVLTGTRIGDSIAVNGVCLTVTDMSEKQFTADIMAETMRRSNLGKLKTGDQVNLERAMAADGRFGGHIVSGHIDGCGQIIGTRREGNAVWVQISASPEIMELIIEKGSITIDGISLTVAAVESDSFQVSIIPHTGAETTLLKKRQGDIVNLENDMVGKYVKKLLRSPFEADQKEEQNSGGVTLEFLLENGF